jgi:hypothetical protein
MDATETEIWQRIQREVGARPDGQPGIATAKAIAVKLGLSSEISLDQFVQHKWPRDTDAEMQAFYGPVGENVTQITPPYQLYYAGKPVKVITVHEKLVNPVIGALSDVLKAYGLEQIKKLKLDRFDGCLNVRKKRGGSTWSVHAYAAALDFCAENNALRMDHTEALFAKAEYEAWWRAWERQGAISLGRERDFDWMHIQFARLS